MSTQFFQRQEAARTNTAWLVVLFSLAVIGIVGVTSGIAYFAANAAARSSNAGHAPNEINPIAVAAIVACVTGIVILLGSLYQIIALRTGGGSSLAESIGGRPLVADTATGNEKRLLNVVEEMAIASGTPVPPVYLLEEPGINAFAAGYRPADAVLGVTRGAIDNLNREQLQGVIAHEFSHVLNGDMRMNIRMIGILHGILLLSLIGRMIFQSMRFMGGRSRSSSDKNNGGFLLIMIAVAVSLLIVGGIGSFIGGLIKAAVSRQREYLADASAVQFTRNPAGIGGALKKIAALAAHGRINHPNASVASHLFFSQGVYEGLSGLLATHPPLKNRILAIEPNWDGNLNAIAESLPTAATQNLQASPLATRHPSGSLVGQSPAMGFASTTNSLEPSDTNDVVELASVRSAIDTVGAPDEAHRNYSARLLAQMDPRLRQAAQDPYSARPLVFALLMDRDEEIAEKQYASLRTTMTTAVVALTEKLTPIIAGSPEAMRLPLVDLALPMLRRMSQSQYEQFSQAFAALVHADNRLSIFEWTLAQVLKRNLRAQFSPVREVTTQYTSLSKLNAEVSVLLSTLARVGHGEDQVAGAFAVAAEKLTTTNPELLPSGDCSFERLEASLVKLRRSSERCRGELVDACAACVAADSIVRVREAELLRGIADLLECHMPPMILRSMVSGAMIP